MEFNNIRNEAGSKSNCYYTNAVAYWKCINKKVEMKVKKDKLTEGFIKLMTNMGATFIDVTPKKKKPRKIICQKSKQDL